MVAAAKGNIEIVSLLVSHGADPQIKAADDSSAVEWASRFGHTDIADFLTDHAAVRLFLRKTLQCHSDMHSVLLVLYICI